MAVFAVTVTTCPAAILALLAAAGATPPIQVAPTFQFPVVALTNTS